MTIPIRPSEATLIEVRQALQRIELFRRQITHEQTTDPGAAQDGAAGFPAGSMVTNTITNVTWRSVDDKNGAAVWNRMIAVASTTGGVAATPKGFVLASNGAGDYIPLDVGLDGQVILADSAKTLGVKWGDGPGKHETRIPLMAAGITAVF